VIDKARQYALTFDGVFICCDGGDSVEVNVVDEEISIDAGSSNRNISKLSTTTRTTTEL